MTALYLTLLAVILAATVGTVHLKRASDAAWRRHLLPRRMAPLRTRFAMERIERNFIELRITIADSLTPALARVAAAAKDLGRALEGNGR